MADSAKTSLKINVSLNWRYICIALLVLNLVTLGLWKPWTTTVTANTRKISVSGNATVKSVPDEYVLNPYFEFTNADRTKATDELTKLSSDITVKLKALGVKEEQIKSNTNAYDKYDPSMPVVGGSTNTLQLSYTITVSTKELAQNVQDYLITLKPKGQISPQATFSVTKQKQLESEARIQAIDDAKAKAQKTADQLGAKLGKVITISDGATMGGPIAYTSGTAKAVPMMANDVTVTSGSISVQPGQNDFVYNVAVEYEIK